MTITGGSSLSKEDIDRMVKDAEANAAADKARREAAELRNTGETLVYSVEKVLTDNAEQLPDDVKNDVQADVDAVKSALAGDDDEAVKTAVEKLQQSQSKLGEAIYAQSQAQAQADASGDEPQAAPAEDDDVVDAEVVDDEDEKK